MSQELQLGKYEFYPNDRALLVDLLREIRELRRELRLRSQPGRTDADLEASYRQMAADEANDPNYDEWVEN